MRKKTTSKGNSKSLKTFFIYTVLVILLILISFTIKAFFVIKQSKYDSQHHFTVAVISKNKVADVLSFNPETSSTSLLKIKNPVPLASFGKTFAIGVDATIDTKDEAVTNTDIAKTMSDFLLHFNTIKTNLTIYDIGRLFLLSKNISSNNKIVKEIQLPQSDSNIDKIVSSFFSDESISNENISIEVINASDTSGIGKRLERMLTNMGANVVSVSSAKNKEKSSKIQYSGKETYTINKLKSLLNYPVSTLDNQTIADVVIIIGNDSREGKNF